MANPDRLPEAATNDFDSASDAIRGRLLRLVATILALSALASVVVMLFAGPVTASATAWLIILLTGTASVVGLRLLSRNELQLASQILVLALSGASIVLALTVRVYPLSVVLMFGIVTVTGGILLGRRTALFLTVATLLALAALYYWRNETIVLDATRPTTGTMLLLAIELITIVALINVAFWAIHRLQQQSALAEQAVQRALEQADALAARDAQTLDKVATVGRTLTQIRDLDPLLDEASQLLLDQFGLLAVRIYRLNEAEDALLLCSATGAGAAEALASDAPVPVGPGSLAGAVAETGRAIVLEVTPAAEPAAISAPDMRLAQSEAAVPVIAGNTALGVLCLLSNETSRATLSQLPVYRAIADQLAVAIQNAQYFAEIQHASEELARRTSAQTAAGWERFLVSASNQIDRRLLGDRAAADTRGEINRPDVGNAHQLEPIQVRGATIGYLALDPSTAQGSERSQVLVTAVAGQLGAHLENLRLTQQAEDALTEARGRAEELMHINRLVSAVAEAPDMASSLQIVVDELARATSIEQIGIALLNDEGTALTVVADRAAPGGDVGTAVGLVIPVAGNPATQQVIQERRRVVVTDPAHNPLTASAHDVLAHRNVKTIVILPLIAGSEIIGTVGLDIVEEGVELREEQLDVAETIVYQAASAILRARLYAEQLETAEKLREVDRLKTDFLARMSHELRTPLNAIIGFADVLLMGLDGELTEKMTEDVQLILSGGHYLRDIIGDILDLSRIEAGRLDLHLESFDPVELAADLISSSASLAEDKGLNLALEPAGDIKPIVADRTRVRQILWNIVGNAIKFTNEGTITIRLEQCDDEFRCVVQDTGVGIRPEQLPHIFESFRQVGNTTDPRHGTGLGLSISKSLVELHGGQIWVESEPGVGSTFTFTLPADLAQQEEAGETAPT